MNIIFSSFTSFSIRTSPHPYRKSLLAVHAHYFQENQKSKVAALFHRPFQQNAKLIHHFFITCTVCLIQARYVLHRMYYPFKTGGVQNVRWLWKKLCFNCCAVYPFNYYWMQLFLWWLLI
jgi:hypothetical protein